MLWARTWWVGGAASETARRCQRVWEKEPAHLGSWDERVQPARTPRVCGRQNLGEVRPKLLRAIPWLKPLPLCRREESRQSIGS